ncbi:8-oxo-dGTP diphosphatase [Paenibacillus cellulosilyticus]|uniref:8-oxo-dGTP diphosphatase n=1 Tax=Paenibacillus cellulosilyticus TaxID=375489 RepID=A0A2V2YLN1_9BACL|nr:8-oxo-dGTP diphosphatase [Paenibacillus cellulosilyticus]PWV94525.1 8-oxo-dGTP diphosphatase [Paenibacillus cellulosilyticus]QKS45030.1 8-oxo-dGTP diphosphatase [Paenibacillus cellulosilyticus]
MIKYTICFIRQGSKVLLLNREKASWMGAWNGVGGKLEPNETPREGILREVAEETGIVLDLIQFKGIVTWVVDGAMTGGMYTYVAELPEDYTYETPIKTDEGILDWKELQWILHPKNVGLAANIPESLEKLLFDPGCYEYRCFYSEGKLLKQQFLALDEQVEFEDVHSAVETMIAAGSMS